MRPWRPAAGSVALLFGWWLVGHNGGAGWVQIVGEVLAGTLVVGLLGPAVALRRTRIRMLDNPADARAGIPVPITVVSARRVRLRPLDPPGPEVFAGPARGQRSRGGRRRRGPGSTTVTVTLVPARRGVYPVALLEVATAAPFALLWWRRTVEVPLARPLMVAPRIGDAVPALVDPADVTGDDSERRAPAPIGEPRGVRGYQPGDSRRWVHWPSTAHTGGLMVREMEAPVDDPVTVTVHLPEDQVAAERLAEAAFGTLIQLIDRGTPVVLVTDEPSGSVVAPVDNGQLAGRRLAKAVPQSGGAGPGGVEVDRP